MSFRPEVSPASALEPLLNFDDITTFLSCGLRTVERWKAAGKLPKPDLMIGRSPRWKPETIRRWVDGGGAK
jgi:hypothetical protein